MADNRNWPWTRRDWGRGPPRQRAAKAEGCRGRGPPRQRAAEAKLRPGQAERCLEASQLHQGLHLWPFVLQGRQYITNSTRNTLLLYTHYYRHIATYCLLNSAISDNFEYFYSCAEFYVVQACPTAHSVGWDANFVIFWIKLYVIQTSAV